MINKWLTFNGKGLTSHAGYALGTDQYGPIPPLTVRIRYRQGFDPTTEWSGRYRDSVCTLVSDAVTNIWDITPPTSNWWYFFAHDLDMEEVLGANTEGVTNMVGLFTENLNLVNVASMSLANVQNANSMFSSCSNLVSVGDFFDSVGTTNMSYMFDSCSSLKNFPAINCSTVENFNSMFNFCTAITGAIPLYDTSSATDMRNMLAGTGNVMSGALALYRQASSQASPPAQHSGCFSNCGAGTVTGAAELAQIPTSWGGRMS